MRQRLLVGGPASGRRIETDLKVVRIPRPLNLPLAHDAEVLATLPSFHVVTYVESPLSPVMVPDEKERCA